MADELEKMRRYIKNTRRSEIPERYQPNLNYFAALVRMSRRDDIVDAFILAFSFGFAKGVRFARQENKKRA